MLLSLNNVCAGYGETDIIHSISIDVGAAEIVTIAGTNGAGKSTLSKVVVGLVPKVRGNLTFDGRDIRTVSAEARCALGLAYVPQVANVFGSLTVEDNLKVVRFVDNTARRIKEMLDLFPALLPRLSQRALTLSGGERQMLAFARALMSRPKLILLDEPTAALSPALVTQVFALVKALPAQGVAVLMVEQRARQALGISNRGYILDQGRTVLSGGASDLLTDERMAQLYLGSATPRSGAPKLQADHHP